MIVDGKKNQQTLLRIIERYVFPGSIVRTWAAYNKVVDLGMSLTHQTVTFKKSSHLKWY